MFEQVARELRATLMRERPLGHQAGHLALEGSGFFGPFVLRGLF